MPSVTRAKDRRHDARPGLKVKHRHRVGGTVVERISELVYVRGRPVALLDWVDLGGLLKPSALWPTLRAWWLGDAIGDLVLAPLLLTPTSG